MKRVPANRYLLFALIAGAGVFWDLSSKERVFRDLGCADEIRSVHVPGEHRIFDHPRNVEGQSVAYLDGWVTFRLFTSFNEGALWGVGQGHTWLFAGLSVVAGIGVLVWLFVWGAARSAWLTVSLAFIMGGTSGNLWDRLGLHGFTTTNGETLHAVRDFLLFTFGGWPWPVFNFADAFLVTGAVMLVLRSFHKEERNGAIRGPSGVETSAAAPRP